MTSNHHVHQAIIGGLGVTELLIILAIVILLFGANKLPKLGDALGKSISNFKNASNKGKEAVNVAPKAIEAKEQGAQSVQVEREESHKA